MEFRPNQWQLPFQKPTRLNSVIQPLNSWIKKVTFQPLSLGVVYFRSTRSNEAKKIVKQMNHMKIPRTISAFSPFGKNYYRFPLLDVTFKNAPDFCRAPRTLRESSIRLQRASPGSQDKRAWRRPVGMAEGDIRYDMTGFRWFFFSLEAFMPWLSMIQFPNFGMNIQIPSPIERVIDGFTALLGVSFVFFPRDCWKQN